MRTPAADTRPRPVPLSRASTLEPLVRRLLTMLGRLTGLESTYLTSIDWDRGVQEILYARNVGALDIPERLQVDWSETLCRRALEGGPSCTADVPGVYPDSGAARELGIRTYATVAVRDEHGEPIGTLCGASTGAVDVDEDGVLLMETLAEMIRLHLAAEAAANALEQLARTDSLTLLANRRHLTDELDRVASHTRRHGGTVSLLVIDIDHFKRINDQEGHEVGDIVLVAVAEALRNACRTEDLVGRWGGDEFVVISPATDERGAAHLAERIATSLVALPRGIRVSIGTASASGGRIPELFAAADAALYKAKAGGRNQAHSVRLS